MIDRARIIEQLATEPGLVCAVAFRCAKCRAFVGGAFYSDQGLVACVHHVAAVERYEDIADALANAAATQVPGPRRGRWGDWGWRMDFVYDFAAEPAAGAVAQCQCGRPLVLDWPAIAAAAANGKDQYPI